MSAGSLYLVATPIGNLDDITLRAIRILKEADVIACEDTRHTKGLLSHLEIRTPMLSLHEHNERARIPQILDRLRQGESVALVSDAGTPVISDPGAALVAAAARDGATIVSIPGASAVTAAVALADFSTDRFAFVGFLPRKRGERIRMLEALADLPMAMVIFETPHRLHAALRDIDAVMAGRKLVLVRELTKMHEQVLRGPAAQIADALGAEPRGEITLVVEGAPGRGAAGHAPQGAGWPAPELFLQRLLTKGMSRRDAARALEVAYGLAAKDAYRLATGEG
jgi:16S rRNA (cytidine1402-2'-O)-methyltransferase